MLQQSLAERERHSLLSSDDCDVMKKDIDEYSKNIFYSKKYADELWEYRHVILPKEIAKYVPSSRLMDEDEWRSLGVMQSEGWVHYMIHAPEPHILLFRREKDYQLKYPPQPRQE